MINRVLLLTLLGHEGKQRGWKAPVFGGLAFFPYTLDLYRIWKISGLKQAQTCDKKGVSQATHPSPTQDGLGSMT